MALGLDLFELSTFSCKKWYMIRLIENGPSGLHPGTRSSAARLHQASGQAILFTAYITPTGKPSGPANRKSISSTANSSIRVRLKYFPSSLSDQTRQECPTQTVHRPHPIKPDKLKVKKV
ncbi:hypothetical protein PGT21_018267 [Puccinia graminis f. sp. tritici]|uniref:Uncharacterized protein n=1 Tax=Puccinia graminis f. sp. tritici TaxID=56615 RepID=A0A5B0MIL2_PUCGR|nr:hypothetical protein PGT21_018267 [Puccinia graminis f. sp. tritici]